MGEVKQNCMLFTNIRQFFWHFNCTKCLFNVIVFQCTPQPVIRSALSLWTCYVRSRSGSRAAIVCIDCCVCSLCIDYCVCSLCINCCVCLLCMLIYVYSIHYQPPIHARLPMWLWLVADRNFHRTQNFDFFLCQTSKKLKNGFNFRLSYKKE